MSEFSLVDLLFELADNLGYVVTRAVEKEKETPKYENLTLAELIAAFKEVDSAIRSDNTKDIEEKFKQLADANPGLMKAAFGSCEVDFKVDYSSLFIQKREILEALRKKICELIGANDIKFRFGKYVIYKKVSSHDRR